MKRRKNKLAFVKRQLSRMQDFEYEFNNYDVQDFTKEDRVRTQAYGLGEMNISYFDYYKRISNDG